jgi:hypothetical protein
MSFSRALMVEGKSLLAAVPPAAHDLKAVSIHCASADGIARNDIAERRFHTPCCQAIFGGVGFRESVEIISHCLREVDAITNYILF